MQLIRTSRHKPRASRVVYGAVAAGAAILLAACSSSSSSSTPSSGSSGSSSTSSAQLSELSAAVNKAAEEPTFADYGPGYGDKVANTANLKGKKIMIIPGVSALAACTEIAQATAALATAVGMQPTIFSNNGTTAEHNTAIENAIHQHYAAIAMGCAMDPSQNTPAIAQALNAGIAISVYGQTQEEAAADKVQYNNVDTYATDAKLAADQAVTQHDGKPFQAIALVSKATPATATMETALRAELKATCPGCTVTDVNVEVPDWTNQIASATSSALLQNPNATVIFPFYAGMLTYMLAGIQSAHKSGTVKTYLAFGGGTPFVKLQTADPGKTIIQSDIGGYPPWTGYLMFLQAARALGKQPPIPYNMAIGPNRIVTPDNAVDVLTTGGNGTDWVNGFRALLSLPPLSGSALTAAATLNGAMVSQP